MSSNVNKNLGTHPMVKAKDLGPKAKVKESIYQGQWQKNNANDDHIIYMHNEQLANTNDSNSLADMGFGFCKKILLLLHCCAIR